jgi:dTDP-glucose pyrophosphorylase
VLCLQRFRPITVEKPKVLLPLVNAPLLEYTLEWLALNQVEEVSRVRHCMQSPGTSAATEAAAATLQTTAARAATAGAYASAAARSNAAGVHVRLAAL